MSTTIIRCSNIWLEYNNLRAPVVDMDNFQPLDGVKKQHEWIWLRTRRMKKKIDFYIQCCIYNKKALTKSILLIKPFDPEFQVPHFQASTLYAHICTQIVHFLTRCQHLPCQTIFKGVKTKLAIIYCWVLQSRGVFITNTYFIILERCRYETHKKVLSVCASI